MNQLAYAQEKYLQASVVGFAHEVSEYMQSWTQVAKSLPDLQALDYAQRRICHR
jgi:hypothetical protein